MGGEWVHYERGEGWEEFLNEARLVGDEGRVGEFKMTSETSRIS